MRRPSFYVHFPQQNLPPPCPQAWSRSTYVTKQTAYLEQASCIPPHQRRANDKSFRSVEIEIEIFTLQGRSDPLHTHQHGVEKSCWWMHRSFISPPLWRSIWQYCDTSAEARSMLLQKYRTRVSAALLRLIGRWWKDCVRCNEIFTLSEKHRLMHVIKLLLKQHVATLALGESYFVR